MHLQRFALAAAAALSFSATAQLPDGYTDSTTALPSGAGQVAFLERGALVYFTGTDLVRRAADGTETTLLSFANAVFGSFTVRVSPRELVFGESSNGDLWLVPLDGSSRPRVVANLPFNYDAVPLGPGDILVSAKTSGFPSPDNDLVRVDVASGTTDLIARVPGASGPLCVGRFGSVLYATASNSFPAPPGSTDVVRFSGADIARGTGPGNLDLNSATVVVSGLDPVLALVADEDEDLFAVDSTLGAVLEIPFDPNRGRQRPRVLYTAPAGGPAPGDLALRRSSGAAEFEPFQPDQGQRLFVLESSFGSTSQVRAVAPRRPVTRTVPQSPIPAGPVEIRTSGGPAGGTGILAVGLDPLGPEFAIRTPIDQPIFWNTASFRALLTLPVVFDGNGVATLRETHAGGPLELSVQVASVSAVGNVLGTAEAVRIRLQ